jgi:RNA polymerase sigma-70 factor (ECF subfamily)
LAFRHIHILFKSRLSKIEVLVMANDIDGKGRTINTDGGAEAPPVSTRRRILAVSKSTVGGNDRPSSAGTKPMATVGSRLAANLATPERTETVGRQGLAGNDNPSSRWDNWSALVAQIKAGEDAGIEDLYRLFNRGIRYYFCRHLGPQDVDDRIHDTLLIVLHAIQSGALRDPGCLMGFVRTVVRRQVVASFDNKVHTRRDQTDMEHGLSVADRNDNPEQQSMATEQTRLLKTALESLSPRDREILVRFYLNEESQERICREMSLTDTQFRLTKSRAKGKFGAIGRKSLTSSHAPPVLPRIFPGLRHFSTGAVEPARG